MPKDEKLLDELCSVNKSYDSKGRLLLESKDEVKKRLGRSPDLADAFVLTFAEPVVEQSPPRPPDSIESLFSDCNNGKW